MDERGAVDDLAVGGQVRGGAGGQVDFANVVADFRIETEWEHVFSGAIGELINEQHGAGAIGRNIVERGARFFVGRFQPVKIALLHHVADFGFIQSDGGGQRLAFVGSEVADVHVHAQRAAQGDVDR